MTLLGSEHSVLIRSKFRSGESALKHFLDTTLHVCTTSQVLYSRCDRDHVMCSGTTSFRGLCYSGMRLGFGESLDVNT